MDNVGNRRSARIGRLFQLSLYDGVVNCSLPNISVWGILSYDISMCNISTLIHNP